MQRGFILSLQTRTFTFSSSSISMPNFSPRNCDFPFRFHFPSPSLFCCRNSYHQQHPIDISSYRDTFSRRMAMAGLKPHHRIALGVSGGPDSMALCVLSAAWKIDSLDTAGKSGGFVDGLLAIIVDHGLRKESEMEANLVRGRVSDMGIRCEIVGCDWLEGRPKQGHLQEAAREMRYQIFQKICIQQDIGVLLTAHHKDDQAELFILRLARSSGVLGLAGMAFASQLFSSVTYSYAGISKNSSILLVRPLMDFSKEDMYKICQGGNQDWVEDPTNKSPLFARNRIRMSLQDLSSSIFKSELQALISACRRTRSYVDQVCQNLISSAVIVMDQGYAVIDLDILNPSNLEDICLSKFAASVLQFISQRHRPIRGSASKLLLNYLRTFPCKTSFTAAGCYLCPAPGSRGTKALVCCSVDCPKPLKMEFFQICSNGEQKQCIPSELEQIIMAGKSYSDCVVPDASYVNFLDVTSESILTEARRLNIIGESTYRNILLLQRTEIEHFKTKTEVTLSCRSKPEVESVRTSHSELLRPGKVCYFMDRFYVTWKLNEDCNTSLEEANCNSDTEGKRQQCNCRSCIVDPDMVAEVRPMIESDWLYLTKLSSCQNSERSENQGILVDSTTTHETEKTNFCSNYARLSAQRALMLIKSIPAAARRGLPVLINRHKQLLCIPSIGFKHCPFLNMSVTFRPRVPLGRGDNSFI